MAIAPGTRFERYEILSPLGKGGMGEVYLAQDTRLRRKVALKLLPAEFTQDADRVRRFEQEAYAASALNHPNIITIHEIGQVDSAYYIVTEFIDGSPLRQRMASAKLKLREALDVATQVASALVAAHDAGIVHRDIKPENVMVRRDGYVKVLDFGLAKLIESSTPIIDTEAPTAAGVHTETGAVMGTARYMSPEQARGQKVDVRSDIFSLGVVLYEMIAGRSPFEGATMSDVIAAILTREPPPLTRYMPEVPVELNRIVAKALCKDREERYQVVKDLLIDLKHLKQELNHEQRGASNPVIAAPRGRSLFRRWPLALAGLLAALLALLTWSNVGGWRERLLGRGALPARIESVAVLPLDNFSHDPDQEFFADGMTEALIENLSKISALRVISRTSVMQYKGAHKPLPAIAKELNVDAVIEGSVQRSGDQVKITAQLILAATDQHLWADSYRRDFRDILALQSEVARAIANQINVKLTSQEQASLASARPVSPRASEAYLKGLYYFNQGINERNEETLRKSFDYFEQAISIDPNYAQAYAGLGRAYHWLASYGRHPEFYPQAKEVLKKALRLDENLAEAHGSLAYTIHHLDWDWLGAEREYKRALELNPSVRDGRHGYAFYLSDTGRHDEAIREIKLAEALDPLTIPLKENIGVIYAHAHQFDRAIEQFKNVLAMNPSGPEREAHLHQNLGRAYVYTGMYEQGIAEIQKAMGLATENPPGRANLAWAYAMSGKRNEAIKLLDELKQQPNPQFYDLALISAALGDKDQAFASLEKAYERHSQSLVGLKVDPAFDSLHSDPRFQDLLRRIGLTP